VDAEHMRRFWDERAREDTLFFVDDRLRAGAQRPPRQRKLDPRRRIVGRAPRDQEDPAWLGSAIDLEELRRRASDADLTVARKA
jgi:hypothetical protein